MRGRILVASLLFGLWFSHAAVADSLPVAHGQIIRDFARITFEWPDPVNFTATAQGDSIAITFDREANPDLGALLKAMYPHVKHASRQADGRTIILTLDKPYRIRTFVSDNINGIDILEVKKVRPVVAQVPKSKPKKEMAKAAAVDTKLLASLAPAAGEPEQSTATAEEPAVHVLETVSSEATKPETDSVKKEEAAPAGTPEEAPKQTAEPAGPSDAGMAVPLTYTEKDELKTEGYVKIGLSASEDSAVLRFPFAERVAMAAFTRGKTLWVVISKPITLDVSDFTGEDTTVVGKPDIIPSAKSTIIRIPVAENIYPSATKETDSYNWAILLTAQKRPLQERLRPDLRVETQPAHLFIPALEMAENIRVLDPLVGDEMVIMPLYKPGSGVDIAKDFIEFTLLESAQGIAVIKKADGVNVATLRDGIRITASDGASFTPGLPMVELKNKDEKLLDVTTLFPYQQWKTQNPDDASRELQALFRQIVRAENVDKANESRLNMAKIYLGQGMAAEALGMLDIVKEKDPSYYRSKKLSALRGAANFLMYRYADASRDFAAGELDALKEVDFWRKVIADLLGNPDQDYDFMALNEDYISKYPPEMRRRLMIVAADRSIYEKEYNQALKIIESIDDPKIREPVKDYIRFLMANIAAGTGQQAEAIDIWDELAENYSEPFIRASAELARVVWALDNDELTAEQAEDRLERLRLSWHGDRMELQVIKLLGKMYEDKNDYVNAMRIWHGGILSFPNSSLAVEMKEKMQTAFDIMFSKGKADELPPLDVLAMYYEYRNYAPTGGAGSELVEKLSDRLISVDLLTQAAELIDSQMRYIAEKEQRSRLGAQLAAVHLLNNNPQKALEALQDSLYGENSLLLRLLRNRLAAQAMVDQNRLLSAMQVLGQDTSIEAERIRLTIYWKQRNWDKVIATVEDLLKQREDVSAPLTLDESEALMKLALAYVFESNMVQLQYLRDYFLPLMQDNPYRDAFAFVTQPETVVTTTNFDEIIKNLSDTRDFIEHYNTRIQVAEMTDTAETGKLKAQP